MVLTEVQRVQGTFVKPKDEIQCGLKPGLSVLSKLHSVHCLVQGPSCCPGWTDAKATTSVGLTEAIETLLTVVGLFSSQLAIPVCPHTCTHALRHTRVHVLCCLQPERWGTPG